MEVSEWEDYVIPQNVSHKTLAPSAEVVERTTGYTF